MKKFLPLIFLLVIVFCASCTPSPEMIRYKEKLEQLVASRQADVDKMGTGKTTEAEVLALFGKPHGIIENGEFKEEPGATTWCTITTEDENKIEPNQKKWLYDFAIGSGDGAEGLAVTVVS